MGIVWILWLSASVLQSPAAQAGVSAPMPAAEDTVLLVDIGPLRAAREAFTATDLAALCGDPAVSEFLSAARERLTDKYRTFCARMADWAELGGRNTAQAFCTTGDLTLNVLREFRVERVRLMVLDSPQVEPDSRETPPVILIVRLEQGQAEPAFDKLRDVARELRDSHTGKDKETASRKGRTPGRSDGEGVVSFVNPGTREPLFEIFRLDRDLVVTSGLPGGARAARDRLSTDAGREIARQRARIDKGTPVFFASVEISLLKSFFSFLSDASRGTAEAFAQLLGAESAERLTVALDIEGRDLRESWFLEPMSLPERIEGHQPLHLPAASGTLLALETRTRPGRLARAFTTLLPEQFAGVVRRLAAACSGDVALGLWHPPGPGDFPAMLFGARLRDEEAARRALKDISRLGPGLIVETKGSGSLDVTTIKLRNFAGPTVPAVVIRDGCLWVADSPRLLVDRLGEGAAPAVGADVAARLSGNPAAGQVSFDVAGVFGLFYDDYLPVLKERLGAEHGGAGGVNEKPVFDLDRLPRLTSLARHLGRGHGRLERLDDEHTLIVQRSSLGGVHNAFVTPLAVLVLGGAVGSTLDRLAMTLETQVCAERLRLVQGALETYRVSFGGGQHYPRTLAELLERGLIKDGTAFLVPSDASPDSLEYQDEKGELRRLSVSYRFLPRPGLRLDNRDVLLYEARPGSHGGRFVVFRDGETCHYGERLFRCLVGDK